MFTKECSFYILFDSIQELDEWLDLMLVLQRVTKDFGPEEPFGKFLYKLLLPIIILIF